MLVVVVEMEAWEGLDFCLDGCQYLVQGAAESCGVSVGVRDVETVRILMKPTLRPGCSCILPSSIFVLFRVVVYELRNLVGSLITNGGPGMGAGDLVLCPRGHHSRCCVGMFLVRHPLTLEQKVREMLPQTQGKGCKCLIELDTAHGGVVGCGRARQTTDFEQCASYVFVDGQSCRYYK